MPINVGTTKPIVVTFKNDAAQAKPAPTGAVVTITSSNSAVATIGAVTHPTPTTFDSTWTGTGAGTAQIHFVLTASTGGPLKNKAGATIPNPAPVTVHVTAPPSATTPTQATVHVTTA